MIAQPPPAIVADCVVVGDSLGIGVGAAINRRVRGTSCVIRSRKGAGSMEIARTTPEIRANVTLISIGSNDPTHRGLQRNLWSVRRRVTADEVVWILPRHRGAAAVVTRECARWGDHAVDAGAVKSRDGVHPDDYGRLASKAFSRRGCGGR